METNLYISSDALIYDNVATDIAPGIYNSANIYVQDNRDIKNGLYIYNRNAVAKITNALVSGSSIQIDNSNYVTPNITLAPIVVAEATETHHILTDNDLKAFLKPPVGFENWDLLLYNNNTEIVLVPREAPIFTITYYNLHGTNHTNPSTYTENTPTIVLTAPSSRPGVLFLGWYDDNGNLVTNIPQGSTGNIYLTARWEIIEGCKCKIGYVFNPYC